MPRGIKKENLPQKICVTCERPFTWRKKWEKCWDEVTTCSKLCNSKRREKTRGSGTFREVASEHNDEGSDSEAELFKTNLVTGGDKRNPASAPSNEDKQDETSPKELKPEQMTAVPVPADDISALDTAPSSGNDEGDEEPQLSPRSLRKAAKKETKAAKRALRSGQGPPSTGNKECDLCSREVSMLIRCRTDETCEWRMVCGRCWKKVSGGVTDGDEEHPFYTYGGVWKNKNKNQCDSNL